MKNDDRVIIRVVIRTLSSTATDTTSRISKFIPEKR